MAREENLLGKIREEIAKSREQEKTIAKEQILVQQALNKSVAEGNKEVSDELQKQKDELSGKLENVQKQMKVDATKLKANLSIKSQSMAMFQGLRNFLGADFKEQFLESMNGVGGKLKGMAMAGIDTVSNVAKGIVGTLTSVAGLIAGVIGLQAFIDGWSKVDTWFKANGGPATVGDKIAAGFTNVAATFLGLDGEESQTLFDNIKTFKDKISGVASSFLSVVGILSGLKVSDEGLGTAVTDLGTKMWDAKEELLAVALLLNPAGTLRLAISGMSLAFTGMNAALSAITPILGGIGTVLGFTGAGAIAVGGATILGIAAVVANTFNALYEGIKTFKDKWNETGSFMEALNAFSIEFMSQFLGWPAKLTADAINWVAGLFGWGDVIDPNWDPVSGIRNWFTNLRATFATWDQNLINGWNTLATWMYNPADGTIFGLNFTQMLTDAKAYFVGTYSYITDQVSNLGKWIYNPESGAIFGIDFVGIKNDLVASFVGIKTNVITKVSDIAKWFYNGETGEVFGVDLVGLAGEMYAKVKESVTSIPEKIGNVFSSLMNNLLGTFEGLVNSVIDKINSVIPEWTGIEGIPKVSFTKTAETTEEPEAELVPKANVATNPERIKALAGNQGNSIEAMSGDITAYLNQVDKQKQRESAKILAEELSQVMGSNIGVANNTTINHTHLNDLGILTSK